MWDDVGALGWLAAIAAVHADFAKQTSRAPVLRCDMVGPHGLTIVSGTLH